MIREFPSKKGTPLIAISLAAVVGIAVWLGNGNRDRNAPGDPPRVFALPRCRDKGVCQLHDAGGATGHHERPPVRPHRG